MVEEVMREILWTDSAKLTFNNIVEYLHKEWTQKEVEKFINTTTVWLSTLRRFPEMCRPSLKKKNIRIGILNKNTRVIYHYKPGKKQIEILLFWNPKQNPASFKY
jgi:plasmid stabilization system protein ParE